MGTGSHRVRNYKRRDGTRVRSHSRESRGVVSWDHSRRLFRSAYRHRRDKPVAAIVGTVALAELVLVASLRGTALAAGAVAVLLIGLTAVCMYATGRDMPQVTVGGVPPRAQASGKVPPQAQGDLFERVDRARTGGRGRGRR